MNDSGSTSKNEQARLTDDRYDYLLETEEPLAETLAAKLDKVKSLKNKGVRLYGSKFEKNIDISDLREKYSPLSAGEKAEGFFRIAGRIMIFRRHGKATFCDIKDSTGKMQLFFSLNSLGEEKCKAA